MIPSTVAKAIADKVNVPTSKTKPPIPTTKITEAINRFFFLSKSTLFSIKIFIPLAAMTPNKMKLIPEITGPGILRIKALSFPTNPKITAKTAAPPITKTLCTRVIAKTPIFSP